MARDYGKVTNTFWTEWEPKFRKLGLGRDAIAVALYLKTGPTANWLGLYSLPAPLLTHQAGFGKDVKRALKALRGVCETGYCEYDEESEMVFIPHMAAEEIAKTIALRDNRHPRIVSDLHSFRTCRFSKDFCALYKTAFALPAELVEEISRLHDTKPLRSPLPSPFEAPSQAPSKPLTAAAAEQEQFISEQQQQQAEKFAAAESAAPEEENANAPGEDEEFVCVGERPLERGELVQALAEIGMPEVAKPFALKDPALARAVLSHCRTRFTQPKMKPVANKAGYIRDCLAKPGKYGFVQDGDEWIEPPDENKIRAERKRESDRLRADAATKERQAEDDKKIALHSQRIERWEGLSETRRDKIRAMIRKHEPIYQSADNEDYGLKFRCIVVAEEWEMVRAGRLEMTIECVAIADALYERIGTGFLAAQVHRATRFVRCEGGVQLETAGSSAKESAKPYLADIRAAIAEVNPEWKLMGIVVSDGLAKEKKAATA